MKTIATYQQLSLLIEGILYKYFDSKAQKEFINNHENIHRCFFQLKNQFPNYFQRLTFDTNGHYPYSKDLDCILQDFQLCGIINKLNPTFKTIVFNGDNEFNARRENRISFVEDDAFSSIAAEMSI